MLEQSSLDESILAALKDHFAALKIPISLVVSGSGNARYAELKSLLQDVASASDLITVVENHNPDAGLSFASTKGFGFEICANEQPTGIYFAGIPGGHEFSSFVLAILNAGGLGKFPDDVLQAQVRSVKGPLKIRTFVSLSCENCPEVVQLLNQFALIHSDLQHEMIDGDLASEEVARLKIGAVPAVFSGDQLLLSGKVGFAVALEKFKEYFGVALRSPQSSSENSSSQAGSLESTGREGTGVPLKKHFDVLVVGGGPAGASAAIYSARKGLLTAIVAEKMGGQVADTKGIENLISTVYTEGANLVADLNKHISAYPIEVLEHRRVEKFSLENNREALLSTGEIITFDKMIFATGAKWRDLKVPGEKEYLGRGVAFCPHCDGPLYKGKRVAVVGGGNSGVEAALDLSGICSHITLIEYSDELKADRVLVDKLMSTSNVTVVTSAKTTAIEGDGVSVKSISYLDRISEQPKSVSLDGVFVQIGLVPNSQPLKGLVDMNPFGEIVIDEKGRTSLPGVYAAGDVTTVPFKQIVVSLGEGAKAALTAFEDRMHGA